MLSKGDFFLKIASLLYFIEEKIMKGISPFPNIKKGIFLLFHGAAAAAAAKLLQSCPTLCNPIDGSPPGSAIPGILQARILEWVAISFSNA